MKRATEVLLDREYLGDGVYVGHDAYGGHVVLWLEYTGAWGADAIALDPAVFEQLRAYVERIRARYQ